MTLAERKQQLEKSLKWHANKLDKAADALDDLEAQLGVKPSTGDLSDRIKRLARTLRLR